MGEYYKADKNTRYTGSSGLNGNRRAIRNGRTGYVNSSGNFIPDPEPRQSSGPMSGGGFSRPVRPLQLKSKRQLRKEAIRGQKKAVRQQKWQNFQVRLVIGFFKIILCVIVIYLIYLQMHGVDLFSLK